MRIRTQHGALLIDPSHPTSYIQSLGPWPFSKVGVGDIGATDQQITAMVGQIGSAIPVAGPFISAAAQVAIAVESMFAGCGQTCVEATTIADQAGAKVQSLSDQYWAAPVHTQSMQAAFIQAFNQVVAYVQQNCGNPALGPAGQRCISERIVPGGTAPWCPTKTGCDWYTTIYNPIAHDPSVVPDSVGVAVAQSTASGNAVTDLVGASGAVSSTVAGLPMPLLLGAGGLALLLLLGRKH